MAEEGTRRPTLYSPALLAHARAPQHAVLLEAPTHSVTADNPLCGDRIRLQVRVVGEESVVAGVGHRTRGCALCIASASVMAEQIVGRPLAEARAARAAVEALIGGEGAVEAPLDVFVGVRAAPARAGCVTLPWRALDEIIEEEGTG